MISSDLPPKKDVFKCRVSFECNINHEKNNVLNPT
jgi:hypothetical protein